MYFPPWVDKSNAEQRRASNRLRYIIMQATLQREGVASLRVFARAVGCDHSYISRCIQLGSIGPGVANKAEEVFGPTLIKAENLINPLAIQARIIAK